VPPAETWTFDERQPGSERIWFGRLPGTGELPARSVDLAPPRVADRGRHAVRFDAPHEFSLDCFG
jgi:hypothetical protein